MTKTATAAAIVTATAAIVPLVEGPAFKYGASAAKVPCATLLYTLTAIGQESAATGNGKNGKPNVMAIIAMAAAKAGATRDNPVTGLAIVQALATPEIAALLHQTRAVKYVPNTAYPCPAWASGYVTGAARALHGLLKRA